MMGVFHLQKNWKFSIGKSAFHLVTSSIQGSRGRPGRLKGRKRYGTGDKDEKSVNGTQISIGKFPPGKQDYLFRNSIYSGKFPVERIKKKCSIYIPTGISGIFWLMDNAQYFLSFMFAMCMSAVLSQGPKSKHQGQTSGVREGGGGASGETPSIKWTIERLHLKGVPFSG